MLSPRSSLHAGVARVTITPPIGAILTGFPDPRRRAAFERDPLYATALVLSDGGQRIVVLSCDTQYIHPSVADDVRATVEEMTGIGRAHVMICCSHTHSGPAAYAHPEAAPIDRAYVNNLRFLLSGAVVAAVAELRPVQLAWGTANTWAGVNRREVRSDGRVVLGHNPAGPVDPELGVLRVDTHDGRPLAVLVNYACHPVVLGGESRAISADYVGHMRSAVEAATKGAVLFVQGACGDINPRLGPAPDHGQASAVGHEVAGAVLTAWATAQPISGDGLAGITTGIRLPLLEDLAIVPDLITDERRLALAEGMNQWEPWAAEVLTDPASGRRVTPIEMQVLAVGPLAIVGVPAELFVEIGLALKANGGGRPLVRAWIRAG